MLVSYNPKIAPSSGLYGDVTGSTSSNTIKSSVVTSKVLTGLVSLPGTVVSGDTILSGFGKLSNTLATATSSATANTLVQRDALGGFSAGSLVATSLESNGTTLNIASANNTQTVNLGSGTGVQTINVGNSGVGATTINLGGANDTVNVAANVTCNGNYTTPSGSAGAILYHPGGAGTYGPATLTVLNAPQKNGLQLDTTGSGVAVTDIISRVNASMSMNQRFEARSIYVNAANQTYGEYQLMLNNSAIVPVYFGSAASGIAGVLTTGSLVSSSLTFPSGTLSYYEEYSHVTAFNLSTVTSANVTIKFTRIGRQVTAHVPLVTMLNAATLSPGPILVSTVAFPSRFRSLNPCIAFVSVNNDQLTPASSVGCANITAAGMIEIRPTTAVSAYTVNGAYNFGFASFTATWTV